MFNIFRKKKNRIATIETITEILKKENSNTQVKFLEIRLRTLEERFEKFRVNTIHELNNLRDGDINGNR